MHQNRYEVGRGSCPSPVEPFRFSSNRSSHFGGIPPPPPIITSYSFNSPAYSCSCPPCSSPPSLIPSYSNDQSVSHNLPNINYDLVMAYNYIQSNLNLGTSLVSATPLPPHTPPPPPPTLPLPASITCSFPPPPAPPGTRKQANGLLGMVQQPLTSTSVVEDKNEVLGNYKMSLCNFYYKGRCRNGLMCRFAHGVAELRGALPQKQEGSKKKNRRKRKSLVDVEGESAVVAIAGLFNGQTQEDSDSVSDESEWESKFAVLEKVEKKRSNSGLRSGNSPHSEELSTTCSALCSRESTLCSTIAEEEATLFDCSSAKWISEDEVSSNMSATTNSFTIDMKNRQYETYDSPTQLSLRHPAHIVPSLQGTSEPCEARSTVEEQTRKANILNESLIQLLAARVVEQLRHYISEEDLALYFPQNSTKATTTAANHSIGEKCSTPISCTTATSSKASTREGLRHHQQEHTTFSSSFSSSVVDSRGGSACLSESVEVSSQNSSENVIQLVVDSLHHLSLEELWSLCQVMAETTSLPTPTASSASSASSSSVPSSSAGEEKAFFSSSSSDLPISSLVADERDVEYMTRMMSSTVPSSTLSRSRELPSSDVFFSTNLFPNNVAGAFPESSVYHFPKGGSSDSPLIFHERYHDNSHLNHNTHEHNNQSLSKRHDDFDDQERLETSTAFVPCAIADDIPCSYYPPDLFDSSSCSSHSLITQSRGLDDLNGISLESEDAVTSVSSPTAAGSTYWSQSVGGTMDYFKAPFVTAASSLHQFPTSNKIVYRNPQLPHSPYLSVNCFTSLTPVGSIESPTTTSSINNTSAVISSSSFANDSAVSLTSKPNVSLLPSIVPYSPQGLAQSTYDDPQVLETLCRALAEICSV